MFGGLDSDSVVGWLLVCSVYVLPAAWVLCEIRLYLAHSTRLYTDYRLVWWPECPHGSQWDEVYKGHPETPRTNTHTNIRIYTHMLVWLYIEILIYLVPPPAALARGYDYYYFFVILMVGY